MSSSTSSSPVIIVTGASKGLGLSTLAILCGTPFSARVVCISRSHSDDLLLFQKMYPDQILLVRGDVSVRATSQEAVDLAIKTWGRLDGIVLNAGSLGPLNRIADVDVKDVESLFSINFSSLIHTIQVSLPHLRTSKGSVVMVSSGAAEADYAGWGAYSASKAAMNSLCRTLANEEPEVFSIAIRPGVIDTDMQADIRLRGEQHMAPDAYAKFKGLHTSGALLPPAWPGYVLASLAFNPKTAREQQLSGKFVQWNAKELEEHQNPMSLRK
ncbi:short-chain dehydrogenase [Mrakia frigida]|uniref:short-chain dehydrogenase n=1 Tax=Mrakia frigida TaxID=29902 RepID=UPI003FCC09B7